MSKKRPSSEQVASLIATPLFRRDQKNGSSAATPSTDPITSTPMRMDVDQIRRYDHDPRRNRNSKYAEIKASILAAGDQEDPLESPLVVTKRPGDPDPRYMVSAGGNTRLCILQELWKETGNERFKQTWVIFKPWDSECRTLLSHLKENDLRGDLIFIDRALAIRNVRDLILEERDQKDATLSLRVFSDLLREQGYAVSTALLSWYNYAIDVLYPLLPTALDSGMGRHQVERLRGLHNGFRDVCQVFGLGDDVEGLFAAVVSRNDQIDIDLDHIRRELESEISVSADCDIGRASLALGAALDGGEILVPDNDTEDDLDFLDATTGSGSLDDYGYAGNAGEASTQENSDDTDDDDGLELLSFGAEDDLPGQAPTATSQDEHRASIAETAVSSRVSAAPSHSPADYADSADATDLADLRAQAWDLAAAIAADAGLSDPLSLPESGFGFVLLPEPADGHAACVWWQLACLAGQHPNQAALVDHLPPDWVDHVPTFNPFHLASELYLHWSDTQWHAFTKLVALVRSIHTVTEGAPWIS